MKTTIYNPVTDSRQGIEFLVINKEMMMMIKDSDELN